MEKMNRHVIKIFGLGGGGCNAVNHMIKSGLTGPDFVIADSDIVALRRGVAPVKIQVGVSTTKGRGCGASAEIGLKSVTECLDNITQALAGGDLIFLTAGLGGGTGGGGLPAVARALTKGPKPPLVVAVVTKPFSHESDCLPMANKTLLELYQCCNSVITVDNAKLESLDPDAAFLKNLKRGNDVLYRAVSSIISIVDTPGEINVDFADVKSVLTHKGPAIISFGEAKGAKRASEALNEAIASPLVADASLAGAKAVICDIAADSRVLVREVMDVNQKIRKAIGPKARLFFGLVIDESLRDSSTMRVTILASGLANSLALESQPDAEKKIAPPKLAPQLKSAPPKAEPPRLNMDVDSLPRPKPDIKVARPMSASESRPMAAEGPAESPAAESGAGAMMAGVGVAGAGAASGRLGGPKRAIRPGLEYPEARTVSTRESGRAVRSGQALNQGVSAVNNNPNYYESPPYIRKPAD
ncbi:MAG: cell division FtsZ family protein [Deltaproteobacteria bacterium]|jgi:cell division protein FtsZ|nr:cell division FtsZ family protein [Deltaproteobacteria bacterium]